METHTQYVQFEKQFEQKRKKIVMNILWIFPSLASVLSFIAYGYIHKTSIIADKVGIVGLMVMAMSIVVYLFVQEFIINPSLIRDIQKTLKEKKDEVKTIEYEILSTKTLFATTNYSRDQAERLMELAMKYDTTELENILKNMNDKYRKAKKKVAEYEAKIIFYKNVKERTFWQYFVSWKWLKKISV